MVKQFIKSLAPQSLITLRHRLRLLKHSAGRYRCPVCNERVAYFEKLPKPYHEQMQKYGFAFEAHGFETCNSGAYSCPLCGASDRDRLYALYLKNHIPAHGRFSLLDIAPSPP